MKNNWPNASLVIVFSFFLLSSSRIASQIYYVCNSTSLNKVIVDEALCTCDVTYIGPYPQGFGGMTFSPEGDLYYLNNITGFQEIQQIDTLTSNIVAVLMSGTPLPYLSAGVVSVGGGIFYSMPAQPIPSIGPPSDVLSRWDTNTSTLISVGNTGYPGLVEMCMADGAVYYTSDGISTNQYHIIRADLQNPVNSEIAVSYPHNPFIGQGLSAGPVCNTLIITDVFNDRLVLISLVDGAMSTLCNIPLFQSDFLGSITSMLEFEIDPPCNIALDLDCNNSSGATGADYNGNEFDCLSGGSGIADDDIKMIYDSRIVEMSIQVTGFMPDAPKEILEMSGFNPLINVVGDGTDHIILTDAGGAKSTDFKDALRNILYRNTALSPTPGLRTIDVYFTTESGQTSNIATAFIEVIEVESLEVDLGPDQQVCEGESFVFNAGNPGATYTWSTGEHTQTITAIETGDYIVNVSDGEHCPTEDTVLLEVLPIVNVSLSGPSASCDNEVVQLIILSDAPFSFDLDVEASPGSPFHFTGVTNNFSFTDFPNTTTTYSISNIIPSEDACIVLAEPYQLEVFSSYTLTQDVAICDGDSIWLGLFWETEAGVYENTLNTIHGCDSTVTTNLSILPAIQISQSNTTCDSVSAGVFITYLNNPNGCDTVVTTTVSLLSSDTTQLQLFSCTQASTGVTTQTLPNQNGCDSLVITTTSWTPPSDTTFLNQLTCDSAALGIFQSIVPAQDGCDSMIITSIRLAPSDTTYLSGISCDSASIGVNHSLFSNQQGCDSLVITTVNAGSPDTTLLFSTSCDSASLGVFETHFTTQNQCDSIVIRTVTYSAQDSTFIMEGTCDPSQTGTNTLHFTNIFGCDSIVMHSYYLLSASESFIGATTCNPIEAGIFVDTLVNYLGCDSIVHLEVSLLPSDAAFLNSSTCRSSEAGIFITELQNQFGCDSTVTLTVDLIPADTTSLVSMTCNPDEIGIVQNIFTNHDGCDSLVIENTLLFPQPHLNVQSASEFNGYDISCFGESDGSAVALGFGLMPFQYSWSTGDTTQVITGLSSGDYAVTLTDVNGCETQGSVTLIEPEEFSIGFLLTEPGCFDNMQGSIEVIPSGGVLPIRYSIDDVNYQSTPVFNNLPAGTYTITALDGNDCETKEVVWINVPLPVNVELGDDQIIQPGDTTIIAAVVDLPIDSLTNVSWTGLSNAACPTCLEQPIAPIISSAYSISVTNTSGCSDSDSVIVFVENNIDVYVPNIFSPNGDGVNDRFIIGAGPQVEVIESLQIFDRWGNMVFQEKNFIPGDVNAGWDGTNNGDRLNPAVYAYRLMVRFKDGRVELRNGDITLLR